MAEQFEKVFGRSVRKENLSMWAHLYVSTTNPAKRKWLVDSWLDGGAPYWQAQLCVLDEDKKLYRTDGSLIQGDREDAQIEPERANFIRETVEQWEAEWLTEQSTKPGGIGSLRKWGAMGKLEEADKYVVLDILREHAALLRWAERLRIERDRVPQGDRQPEWAYHAADDVDRTADELQRTGWLQSISMRQVARFG